MALAAGTILYVVFFEIVPRAKEVGATGVEQVAAMTAGFAVFLPTMLLRECNAHALVALNANSCLVPPLAQHIQFMIVEQCSSNYLSLQMSLTMTDWRKLANFDIVRLKRTRGQIYPWTEM